MPRMMPAAARSRVCPLGFADLGRRGTGEQRLQRADNREIPRFEEIRVIAELEGRGDALGNRATLQEFVLGPHELHVIAIDRLPDVAGFDDFGDVAVDLQADRGREERGLHQRSHRAQDEERGGNA